MSQSHYGGSEEIDDGYHLANASQYQGNSFYNYQPRVTIFEHKDFTRGGGQYQTQNRNCCVDRCWSKAEIQGYCIKHYYEVNEQPEESIKSKKTEEEQRLLAEELYTTEKTYKAGLKAIVKGFIIRLQKYDEMGKPLITKEDITKGFLNIQDIYDLSRKFYNDLKNMYYTKTLLTPELGKTLLTYTPFFRLYTTYVNGYEEAATIVTKLRETNKEFEAFMQHCEKVEGNNIQAFMIMPVQRIPRYLMLLKGIMKATDPSEPLYANLKTATDQIEKVANEINTSIHMREARQRVISVQNHLENCTMPLVTPTRYHVKDGPLNKKYNNSSFKISSFNRYWFFLFNDMLMYTTVPNSKGDCKLKYILPLIDMTVHDIPDSVKPKITNSFELKCPVKSITVTALSPTEKREWMETIQKHVTSVIANRATLKPITQAIRGVDPSPSSKSSNASSPPFHSNGSSTPSHSSTTPPITMGTVSIPPPIVPVLNRPQSMQNVHTSPPPPRTQYGGVAVHTKPVTPNPGPGQARVGPPSGPPPPNQPRVPPPGQHSHTPSHSHSQTHASATPPPRPPR